MEELILFPTNRNYCDDCIYHNKNRGSCNNEEYKRHMYEVCCIWKYCKYKKKRGGNE